MGTTNHLSIARELQRTKAEVFCQTGEFTAHHIIILKINALNSLFPADTNHYLTFKST